jgi:chorismate mutase-like protein
MRSTAEIELDAPDVAGLAALRAEIDALDDGIHDLLMRRADVVARLAASRTKGEGPAIRPGREAAILRRLLGRHAGPLPRAALVRLWRELLAATTAMQGVAGVAACLTDAGVDVLRAHLGLAAPVSRFAEEAEAIAAGSSSRPGLVALPGDGRWWRTHTPSRLRVVARLPFFGPSDSVVFLLSPAQPDPSGEDRTLIRLPATRIEDGAPGFAPRVLVRDGDLALAELPGPIPPDDPRIAALGATVLGSYAAPIPA